MTVAQRKWSIYDAQESWLENIHHANHQPLGDSRPTEMKYIWRPTVLASKYTSCKSSTVRWHFRPTEMEYIWSPTVLAPVPLSIFRSNSKFDENSECSSFEYTRPITTIFCTRHNSDTVVTCAKYRCDRPRILYTRVFWIFIEFRIRSKYA